MYRPARWLRPTHPAREVQALAAQLGLHAPAARVLWHRGYRDAAAVQHFLSPSLDDLHDPYRLLGMDAAVERILRARAQGEKILLYGDYDVDGTSSIVVLRKALELAGANVSHFVPHRLRDGYGMRSEVIAKAAADGIRLIISVDTGIRAAAVVADANARGLDCIITDHHLPEAELPAAIAVLNPNRPDCSYPEKNLCGAGVAFKLVQALLQRLDWPADRVRRLTESFLKLVALATVADVVPLTGENRVIVRRGLEGFRGLRNPGLLALLRVAGFAEGESPSAQQVAWRVAPRINAAGRMASADDVIELFMTANQARADELAQQLQTLNQERQATEADIVNSITAKCLQVPVSDEQAALVFAGEGWHRGVVGIVASRVVERYHRPVFILSVENGIAQGSGRSIPQFHLLDALESMPELFMKFGGHRQAAGLTMPADRLPEFRTRLEAYAATKLLPDDFCTTIEMDAPLDLSELNNAAAEEVLSLAPFGCGNAPPVFSVEGAEIVGQPRVFGEKHVRFQVTQGGRPVSVKAWRFLDRLTELVPGRKVDLALAIEEDPYSLSRGYAGWGTVLKDLVVVGE